MREGSKRLGLQLIVFDVRAASELERVLGQIARAQVDGIIVQEDYLLDSLVDAADSALTAFALKQRLPLAAPGIPDTGRGVLLAYAFDWDSHFGDAARLLDKLMKGARPGELPVVQSARFRLVVDLNTARAIGVELPESLLLRADKVIR
jgi:putative ABC transport system substrate-binding protein